MYKLEEKLSTSFYQKLPELIERVIMKTGRFHNALLLILSFNFFMTAISDVVTTFHSYQPDFQCGELGINQCQPDETCHEGYQFLGNDKSVVSEWSLVCSQRLVGPTINTLYFIGSLFGVCFGSISDWVGRKPTIFLCMYLEVTCCICLSFCTEIQWFIVIRMFQGFFTQGVFTVVYPLAMEYCTPNKRTMISLGIQMLWAIGLMYLGIVAYAFRNWREMQLILALPGLLTLTWTWLIPESIQWLCSKQEYQKAFEVLVQFAKRNGNYNEIEEEHRYWSENLKNKPTDKTIHEDSNTKSVNLNMWGIFRSIFTTSCLRKHFLIMSCTWFIITTSYFCILFYMPTLASDRHVNFLISAVIELFVYVSMYFVLSRHGRRMPMIIYLILNGITLGVIGILASFEQNVIYITIATLISRGVASSLYYAVPLYTSELFPTVNRTCAYGLCGFVKQVGNIVSPFLLPLFHGTPIVPLVFLAILSIATGIGHVILPETLNIQMPNTIEEAKAIWK